MTPHIVVATPMYGGQNYGFFAQSIFNLQTEILRRQWNMELRFMYNESLITRGRNALAHIFLKGPATHLLFIDADISFNPAEVLDMVIADKDIICGLYPKKEINWHSITNAVKAGVPPERLKFYTGAFVVNLLDGVNSITIPSNQPFEIMAGGTGCMLIKRKVFEELKAVTPAYNNDVLIMNSEIGADPIYNFFDTSICPESNRLLSEDFHFCAEWRKLGGSIWAAPWVNLAHVGTYVFDGKLIPEEPK